VCSTAKVNIIAFILASTISDMPASQ